jgi:flagellar protein FliS
MFTPINMRSVNTYKTVAVETAVTMADPHQLVSLLFDALLQSLVGAKVAIEKNNLVTKGPAITKAVRILEEGLKAGLDMQKGGEVALTLRSLYDYCIYRITEANLHNDTKIIDEVVSLLIPVADGWKQIRSQVVSGAKTRVS